MTTDEMIRELRQTAINASPSLHRLLCAAADRLEELDERVAIVSETEHNAWDVFERITSAYSGKQMYFREPSGVVYDRYKGEYITFTEAINRFVRMIDQDWGDM